MKRSTGTKPFQTHLAIALLALQGLATGASFAETFNTEHVESVVHRALQTFHTPGMAVAVVHGDNVVMSEGFGVRNLATNAPVTNQTYFRLASTSKAFTAASVAMLVERDDLDWDDRVIDYLPQFRLYDAYATREMTLRDLLTHRSGLGSGAGDAMLWPEPAGFSREEIVSNLRYLTPQSSFRSRYAYSNVMYITAAEVVSAVVGKPWDEYIDDALFGPLGMSCFAGDMPKTAMKNIADAYGHNDERGIYAIPRNGIHGKALASAAAGGIVCNAEGMAKWLQHLLALYSQRNDDTAQAEDTHFPLFSPAQLTHMWSANTVLGVSDTDEEWDGTVLKSYGLGWRLSNFLGHKMVSHTGTLSGYQAYAALLPDLNVGFVLLNNGSNYGARGAVMQTLLRQFVDEAPRKDWIEAYVDYQAEREQRYLARHTEPQGTNSVSLPASAYTGEFTDKWFGSMTVSQHQDSLRIHAQKMPMLTGELKPFRDHTWVIEWDNQNAASNAFIHFSVNANGNVTGFRLHPYDVDEIENHEWRDMVFAITELN
ncbi:serine hydrolase [Alteromonas oceanisediminis]|uniref:serine hydrolase n=1 Tax=Alteromonas oceanisediminis TaxID=2836180 RepID=UPI001BDA96E7|nr:serine hydrolase [Alteromonas oceanisediminis]MBT0585630.1 beta-lactamase family protein [Alteromonas oceanisediminis]